MYGQLPTTGISTLIYALVGIILLIVGTGMAMIAKMRR